MKAIKLRFKMNISLVLYLYQNGDFVNPFHTKKIKSALIKETNTSP
jgi:hypothetical protein